jgi:hypothetical protein
MNRCRPNAPHITLATQWDTFSKNVLKAHPADLHSRQVRSAASSW